MQYFSISGRAALTGLKGYRLSPLQHDTLDEVEFDSEPIRLTFDASKGDLGPKYTHFVDVWVAYRYWQNKYGYDNINAPNVCTVGGVVDGAVPNLQ